MTDIEYMTECMTKDLILLLMERRNMDLETALDTIYTSDTFQKLKDSKTGLYFQSPLYVYDFLEKEIEVCYSELEVENIIFTLYFTRFALSLSLT